MVLSRKGAYFKEGAVKSSLIFKEVAIICYLIHALLQVPMTIV